MTAIAYTGNPSTSREDAIRLLVGDISTSTAGEFLADGDYTYFAGQQSSDYLAAAMAADTLAGKTADAVDKRVGDLQLRTGMKAPGWRAKAALLRQEAAKSTTLFVASVSESEKEAFEDDADVPQPKFTTDLFARPGTGRFTSTST